jgi:hypothetical protein
MVAIKEAAETSVDVVVQDWWKRIFLSLTKNIKKYLKNNGQNRFEK